MATQFARRWTVTISIIGTLTSAPAFAGADHKERPIDNVKGELSVMVLGSGGPLATAGRASAGYLIFTDGKPRLLMDVGGGTFQRIAASGADIKDLDYILISHLHIDHMADLSAVIKSIYFQARQDYAPRPATHPIAIYGPDENLANAQTRQFPSSQKYVDTLYDKDVGIERYMNSFATAISGGQFAYTVANLTPTLTGPATEIIHTADGLVIKTAGVFHGPVPSVAFRVEYKGHSVVYSGDTNSKLPTGALSPAMVALSQDADLLIYDTAITDTEPSRPGDTFFFQLHTTPTTMGQIASQARAKTLVLSHITPITDVALDEVKTLIRAQGFTGNIKIASDLKVYNLGGDGKHSHDD